MRRRSSLGISGLVECEVEDEEQREVSEEQREVSEEQREVSEEPPVRMYGLVGGRGKEQDKQLVSFNDFLLWPGCADSFARKIICQSYFSDQISRKGKNILDMISTQSVVARLL